MEATFEKEREVLSAIKARFAGVDDEKAVVKTRRVYLSVPQSIFMDVLGYVASDLGFSHMCTITGLDTGTNFEFLYHVAQPGGVLITLKFQTGREDPVVIQSVLPIYNGATFYERELESLLGVKVEGLPEGRPYPLPDNWPKGEYPMRKDWKPKAAAAAGDKEGQNG